MHIFLQIKDNPAIMCRKYFYLAVLVNRKLDYFVFKNYLERFEMLCGQFS